MNNKTMIVFLANDTVRALKVAYENPDEWAVGTVPTQTVKTFDPAIKVGDYVNIVSEARHKISVAKVMEADVTVDFGSNEKVHWVIGVIDPSVHAEIVAQEAELLEAVQEAKLVEEKAKYRKTMNFENIQMDTLAITSNTLDAEPIDT